MTKPKRKPTDRALLAMPEGRAVYKRCLAATTEFYAPREEHARQITLVVLRAKGV